MPRRSPTLILAHVVWATLGRRPVLEPSRDDSLIAIFGGKARDAGCLLLTAGCAVDHVHVLVRISPSARLADLVQRMKGGGAYDANHASTPTARIEWQAGYWAESFSPADLDALTRYVQSQRSHHDPSHPAERWQFGDDGEPALPGGL
jgi:putative transposase